MEFKAIKTDILKKNISKTEKLSWFGLFLLISSLFILIFNEKTKTFNHINHFEFISKSLSLIGLMTLGFSFVYQFFDYENIAYREDGIIELSDNELIIDSNERIKYDELTDFNIFVDAFYKQKINLSGAGRKPKEKKSLGISNIIYFNFNSNIKTFTFKLENQDHLRTMENDLFEIIVSNKLSNIDSKKSVKLIPERFKQTIKYKNYVGNLIQAKKINCSDGLLLHGYDTYEEAQELKKKYCS